MSYAYLNNGSLATCNKLTSVPEGVESVEFERGGLPAAPDTLTIVDGVIVVDPTKEAISLAKQAKNVREEALANLTHDFGDGRVIQVRKVDEQNIRTAIAIMERTGTTQYPFFMADNTQHLVTVAELEAAIVSGQDQGAAVWADFFSTVGE